MPFTSAPPGGVYAPRPTYSKEELCAAYVGLTKDDLRTPALLIDRSKAERNARELCEAADTLGVAIRVHVKSHKTIEGGLLQTGGKPVPIIVSTLAEARYFAHSGLFPDILYAVPLSPDRIQEVHQVSLLVEHFHVLVDNEEIMDALERYALAVTGGSMSGTNKIFRAFMKIDTGYGRAGVPWGSQQAIELAARIHNSPSVTLSGIYSHSGHAYSAATPAEALEIAQEEIRCTQRLAQRLRSLGISAPFASIGATPSVRALLDAGPANIRRCMMEARLDAGVGGLARAGETAREVAASVLPDDEQDERIATESHTSVNHQQPMTPHDYVLELHAGNYMLLDVQQVAGMPLSLDRCAATVLGRVISRYPLREEVMLDTGALALSKDGPGVRGEKLFPGFGVLKGDELGKRTISRISQEHGVIAGVPAEQMDEIWPLGKSVEVYPNHVCLAAANFDWYYLLDGDKVMDVWIPCRGW